jgi:acyl-CoA synthetase (AMP-forming)/AMP-acid ligase II
MLRRLEEIPAHWARVRPEEVVLHEEDRHWTWLELDQARQAIAGKLSALGVRPGDRVMLVGENCASMIVLFFALATLDAWIVNVNARMSAREIELIRAHARPRRVIYLAGVSPVARSHAEAQGASDLDLDGWGEARISSLDADAPAEPLDEAPEQRVAALLYTTGTTGDPKGVMLTHAGLMFIARLAGELRGLVPSDRVYGLLPFTHVYGMASVVFGSLCAGTSLDLQPRFAPDAMANALEKRGITVCQGVPAMYAKFLDFLESRGKPFRAPALRFLYAGGAPLSSDLQKRVEDLFGLPLNNGYGLTEASPTVTQTRPSMPRSDGSVGTPLPGVEIRLVDVEGRDVKAGEPGELWVRGPNVMKGYYRNPEATAEVMRPGGWLATGDIARMEADGAVFIEARLKELIIRSGFNVYPAEIETVLNAHPDVAQSAVVGRDVAGNEEVVAFVELKPGASATPADLSAFAAPSLAPYKRPAEVIVLPSLPAAANGKVLKAKLRAFARERPGVTSSR